MTARERTADDAGTGSGEPVSKSLALLQFIVNLTRSRLARQSALYVGSSVANRLVPFLLLPIMTRVLSPEDFGIATMFTLAVSLVSPVIGLSTDGAITRQYFERDRIDFPNYITNCLYLVGATTAVALLILLVARDAVATVFSVPGSWLWGVVAVAVFRYLCSVLLGIWQVQSKTLPYALFSFGMVLASFGGAVLFVVVLHRGWQGRVLGDIIAVAAFGAGAAVLLRRGGWIRVGVDRAYLLHAVKFGGGLMPHVYGGIMIAAADRLFLTGMLGVSATGLYVVGAQVALVIAVLEQSFNLAWTPWLYARLNRNSAKDRRDIRAITVAYNVVILSLAVAMALIAPWLLGFLVGPQYRAAGTFVLWLAFANAFGGMYKMVVNQIFFANKTHLLSWITLTSGLINVPLCWILIKQHGAVGAAQATALAMFVSYALTAMLSARVMRQLPRQAT